MKKSVFSQQRTSVTASWFWSGFSLVASYVASSLLLQRRRRITPQPPLCVAAVFVWRKLHQVPGTDLLDIAGTAADPSRRRRRYELATNVQWDEESVPLQSFSKTTVNAGYIERRREDRIFWQLTNSGSAPCMAAALSSSPSKHCVDRAGGAAAASSHA